MSGGRRGSGPVLVSRRRAVARVVRERPRFGEPAEHTEPQLPGDRYAYALVVSPGTVRVRALHSQPEPEGGGGGVVPDHFAGKNRDLVEDAGMFAPPRARGVITEWSRRSRVRMMYRLATIDWSVMPGVPEMATLTYGAQFPTDGAVVKRHLRLFGKRFFRRWGVPFTAVWKLEFQRRGAPHLHVFFGRPLRDGERLVPWREFLDWMRSAWHSVAYACSGEGQGCCAVAAHRSQGVRLDRDFGARATSARRIAWYFTWHASKAVDGAKGYQNVVPEGFENVGRWWGLTGELAAAEHEVELSREDFVQVRRIVARLRRAATGRRVRVPGRLLGGWTLCESGERVGVQLLRWLEPPPSHVPGSVRTGFAACAPPLRQRQMVVPR